MMGWQTQSVIQLFAGDTIINPNGMFVYSAAPAVGNLVFSVATATKDNFGNNTVTNGAVTYGAGFAAALNSGALTFYTGSLAGGWTFAGQIETDGSSDIILAPNGVISLVANTTVTGTLTVTGTASINGSTSTAAPSPVATVTAGLTDGTINGTSGAASAGTAHTHGAGSFAVANGQHVHNMNSHTHVL